MSNEITSMLQPVMPKNAVAGPARSGSQPTVVDSSRQAQGDRVSLTDSARLLQLAESKPGTGRPGSDNGMTYTRTGDGFAGKGLMTSANGREYTREVSVAFDPDSKSVSRQVTITGENGFEVSRATDISRSEKGVKAVTTRVGARGNEIVRENQRFADPDNAAAGSADRLVPDGQAQRPSPALANMTQSFFTSSDMEGFDASADLNGDGIVNFSDLAALRAMESGAGPMPTDKPQSREQNMADSFFTTKVDEGFDADSDLNSDGVVNFQDLALLRAKMEGS